MKELRIEVIALALVLAFSIGGCRERSPVVYGPIGRDTVSEGWPSQGPGDVSQGASGSKKESAESASATLRDTDHDCGGCAPCGCNLELIEEISIPSYGTGAPSVFSDLHIADDSTLFLVSDQQQCEIALVKGSPAFSSEKSFCALTPGYVLRGWSRKQGGDFIVDAASRTVVPGKGAAGSSPLPLPERLFSPSGLATDGLRFFASDDVGRALWILQDGGPPQEFATTSGGPTNSVTYDGLRIWVLRGQDLIELGEQGQECRSFTLDKILSGFAWSPGRCEALATSRDSETLYRYRLSE